MMKERDADLAVCRFVSDEAVPSRAFASLLLLKLTRGCRVH